MHAVCVVVKQQLRYRFKPALCSNSLFLLDSGETLFN